MAHIFNIYFNHDEASYNAMVSVQQKPFFKEFVLGNLHESVKGNLPGKTIVRTPAGNYYFKGATDSGPSPLMEAIIEAVSQHVENIPA